MQDVKKGEVTRGGDPLPVKKALSWESLVFVIAFTGVFGIIGYKMGIMNMMNTLMNTAYSLLIDTVFYIMAIAVLAGALSALLTEFGVVSAANKILSPLMKPVYGLPGASIIGIFTTYFSDNPAILTLADDDNFLRTFKKYQVPALTNLGTAFGMGLIISTYMIGIGAAQNINSFPAVLIGNLGAIIGSVVSVRLMLIFTKGKLGTDAPAVDDGRGIDTDFFKDHRVVRLGNAGSRFLDAMLEGGKSGVEIGAAIIPGVLIICSLVMMLSGGPAEDGSFTGAAYEGVGFLPWVGEKLNFILKPLFGFESAQCVAVPITALGAAGAAIGLVPNMLTKGLCDVHDIAVFTSMCMCWSGYLSTHIAMMDQLHYRDLTGKAILCHTIGGLCAGISANLIYTILF